MRNCLVVSLLGNMTEWPATRLNDVLDEVLRSPALYNLCLRQAVSQSLTLGISYDGARLEENGDDICSGRRRRAFRLTEPVSEDARPVSRLITTRPRRNFPIGSIRLPGRGAGLHDQSRNNAVHEKGQRKNCAAEHIRLPERQAQSFRKQEGNEERKADRDCDEDASSELNRALLATVLEVGERKDEHGSERQRDQEAC